MLGHTPITLIDLESLLFNFCTWLPHGTIIETLPLPASSQHRARQTMGAQGYLLAN